jgi:large repetitive protein
VQISTLALSPQVAGITLHAGTGAVTVAQGTPVGAYALAYQICEIANPGNCDTANATVTVRPNAIDAVNDYGRGSSKVANTPIASVLANDTLNGVRAATPAVKLSQVALTPATSGITLNLTTGAVSVKPKTSSGVYSLTYRICEAVSPTNCDTAVATIELSGKSN